MAGIGDMLGMMKNAKQMMEKAKESQVELGKKTVEGNAGAGMVKATVNGHGELVGLVIDPSAATPGDTEFLAELVVAAVADGRKKADVLRGDALRELSGGVDLSGLGFDPMKML